MKECPSFFKFKEKWSQSIQDDTKLLFYLYKKKTIKTILKVISTYKVIKYKRSLEYYVNERTHRAHKFKRQ